MIDFLETVESQSWMGPLKHSASYVPCTGASLMHSSSSSTWSSIISGGSYICMGFLSIIEAICHILNCPVQPMKERCKSCYMAIFHRGSRSTSSTFTNSTGSTGSGTCTGTNTTTRGRTLRGSVAGEVNEDEDERGQVQFSNNIGIRNPLLGRVGGQGYQPVSTNDTSNDVESPKGNIANV